MNKFDLIIDKSEVLRYLGYKYQLIDENLSKMIDKGIKEIKELSRPRYIIDNFEISKENAIIKLEGDLLYLEGKEIYKHLINSSKVVLLAATLGIEVDRRISYYQKIDLTYSLILDVCATQAIEEVCDILENDIRNKLKKENKGLTYRFSPGYGDLSIDIQSRFINILDATKKIGLTATSDNILIPRKSVTAIMGVVESNISNEKIGCIGCSKYNDCNFRRVGEGCGH